MPYLSNLLISYKQLLLYILNLLFSLFSLCLFRSDKVDAIQSFWLAEAYYHEANIYYAQCQKMFGSQLGLQPKPMGSQSSLKSTTKSIFGKIVDKLKSSSSSSSSSSDSGSEKEVEVKDEESDNDNEDEDEQMANEEDGDKGSVNGDDNRASRDSPDDADKPVTRQDEEPRDAGDVDKPVTTQDDDTAEFHGRSVSDTEDHGRSVSDEEDQGKVKKVVQENDDDW